VKAAASGCHDRRGGSQSRDDLLPTCAMPTIILSQAWSILEIPHYRLTSAATQLAWSFRALRMRAISQHHTVTVTFTNSHVYTVWTDRNDNSSSDSGEVHTTDLSGAYPGVQLDSTTNPVFNPTGTVTNLPTMTLTNPSGAKTLTMNILGDITIQ
jgi:hypothetical protein